MNSKPNDIAAIKPKSVRQSNRDARLKAALKANMARRKAQALARSEDTVANQNGQSDANENEKD